jgi:hypothetical protein
MRRRKTQRQRYSWLGLRPFGLFLERRRPEDQLIGQLVNLSAEALSAAEAGFGR